MYRKVFKILIVSVLSISLLISVLINVGASSAVERRHLLLVSGHLFSLNRHYLNMETELSCSSKNSLVKEMVVLANEFIISSKKYDPNSIYNKDSVVDQQMIDLVTSIKERLSTYRCESEAIGYDNN